MVYAYIYYMFVRMCVCILELGLIVGQRSILNKIK